MSENYKDLIKAEYIKCANDPVYFMKKYCYIQHRTKGRMLFTLFKFQERVLEEYRKYNDNIILKSRQLGISTLTGGFSLWMMIFHSDKNIVVIATKQEVAKNLVSIVRFMYDNLPSWLKVPSTELNKLSIRLSNGSQIKAVSSAGDAGRSEAASLLVVDECAFIENMEEIWGSAQQTLSTGGKSIILSTPNGTANWYHKMWADSKAGKNSFNTIQLHWSMHPERDQAWRDRQTDLLGARLAAQECDADFLASGKTLVDLNTLDWYMKAQCQKPIEKRNGDLWVWESPNYNKQYIVTADVSTGNGDDFSTCHVIDLESLTQVAEFEGLIDTNAFGNLLVSLATEYNDAILVIENTGYGYAAVQKVVDRGYKNLFYMERNLKYVDPSNQHTNRLFNAQKKAMAGFSTNPSTRPLIIGKVEEYCNKKLITLRSERLVEQLKTFIWNGNKAEAASGYNDDLVMALAIGLWVRDTALQLNLKNIELDKRALGMFDVSRSDNMTIYMPGAVNTSAETSWRMPMPLGESEDLTQWL